MMNNITLTVGITGHRLLAAPSATRLGLRWTLGLLRKHAPSQLVLLSPLAEGADRKAAETVLEQDDSRLEVVLPFPPEDYRRDFETDASWVEFETLLARAAAVETRPPLKTRGEAYESAGRRVVDRCDILVAVWDGRSARGLGGTAQIVAYARKLGRPLCWIHSDQPWRVSFERMPDGFSWGRMACPSNVKTFDDTDLSAEVARRKNDLTERLSVLTERHSGTVSVRAAAHLSDRLKAMADHFLPRYVEVNRIALLYQTRYRRASVAVLLLSAAALIVVAAQYIFHLPHGLVAGEVAAIATILSIFHLGNRFGWHRNWIDYRFLAERIRCGLFVSFLSGKIGADDEQHWSDRLIEESWCHMEFDIMCRVRPRLEKTPREALPVLQGFMQTAWLGPQRVFHARKKRGSKRVHDRISAASYILFWLTFVAAVLHLMPHDWLHAVRLDRVLTTQRLTFLVIALPALGTLFTGLRGHFEFKKQSVRSGVMEGYLGHLEKRLAKAEDLEDLYHVVWETEHLMRQENADWHLNTGLKPIEVEA